MSMGELLLTLIVVMFVFGPKKLPMLAQHLGKLVGRINHYKQQALNFWQQLEAEQQLQENLKKAKEADASYQPTEPRPLGSVVKDRILLQSVRGEEECSDVSNRYSSPRKASKRHSRSSSARTDHS